MLLVEYTHMDFHILVSTTGRGTFSNIYYFYINIRKVLFHMYEALNFIYLFTMYTIEIIGSIILLLLGLTGYGNKQAEKLLISILT